MKLAIQLFYVMYVTAIALVTVECYYEIPPLVQKVAHR